MIQKSKEVKLLRNIIQGFKKSYLRSKHRSLLTTQITTLLVYPSLLKESNINTNA